MSPCSKVVEYLTHVLIIKGSNHATGNEREKNDEAVIRYRYKKPKIKHKTFNGNNCCYFCHIMIS